MIQTVIKRDGRIVGYNEEKIKAAIRKAMLQTEKGEDESLIQKITDRIGMTGKEQMSVEEIQDNVELELMKSSRKEVAKRYIAYRDQRSIARRAKTRDIFLEIIEAKSNDITRENANMNADSPAGMMMKFASETTKPFVDDYLLSPETADAIKNNYIHVHDKDYYPTKSLTCVQHPLNKVLKEGFVAGHGESRPAKRIETASIIGCISLETAQNEMHGGQAIPAFDFYLAPYVRTSFIEEVKNMEAVYDEDFSDLYTIHLDDFKKAPLDGLQGKQRAMQHAINKTVDRVSSGNGSIYPQYEHHPLSRRQPGCVQLHKLWNRHICRGTLYYPRTAKFDLRRSWKRSDSYFPHTNLEKEKRSQLLAGRSELRFIFSRLQSICQTFFPEFSES